MERCSVIIGSRSLPGYEHFADMLHNYGSLYKCPRPILVTSTNLRLHFLHTQMTFVQGVFCVGGDRITSRPPPSSTRSGCMLNSTQ